MKTIKNTSLFIAFLGCLLFLPLFLFHHLGPFDFWWWISANIAILTALSLALDRSYLSFLLGDGRSHPGQKILLGVLSGTALYLVFSVGSHVSLPFLPFAPGNIAEVYSLRRYASPLRIIVLLMLVIGPGEELFWRGYVQRRWQNRFGPLAGWLLAAVLYALVHLASGNIMLVLAALICGLFWGALFHRSRSVLLVAVSHTLWDILIFVALPLENGARRGAF